MKKNIKFVFMAAMLVIMPCICYAQSASESYNKGIALMNKAEYTEAIASFRASMAINRSAANIKKCKAQIAKCQRLARRNTAAVKPQVPSVTRTLKPEKQQLLFGAAETTLPVKINTTPENADWIAELASKNDNWCKLAKSMDGRELQVTCSSSKSTIRRTAKINVIYDNLTSFIEVIQQGHKPQLCANTTFVEFGKRKGGEKKVSVTCNSDTLYADKKNWVLEKVPEWCDIQIQDNYLMTIKVDKLTKKDPEFKIGRTGDIVIRSQEEEWVIRVDQK